MMIDKLVSSKKKRSAIVVGMENPIRVKSKLYVMKNYVAKQIEQQEGIIVESVNPESIYKTLKRIGWLREINYMAFYMITANYAIA